MELATKTMIVTIASDKDRTENYFLSNFSPEVVKDGQKLTLTMPYIELPEGEKFSVYILATDSPEPKTATDSVSLGYFGLRLFLGKAEATREGDEIKFTSTYNMFKHSNCLPLRPGDARV